MSTYSIIGLIILGAVLVIGTVLKIVLAKRRRNLEGFHGYVKKGESDKSSTDDWELL